MGTFRVGQRVVCVISDGVFLTKGATYVASRTAEMCCGPAIGVGINCGTGATKCTVCGSTSRGDEVMFDERRFRPLIEDLTAELARKESDRLVEERPEHVNEPQHA